MKFVVNNQEWQLKFVNPNNRTLMRSDGSITIGMTDNIKKTVFINNKLKGQLQDKVLCHELTHVFAFEYDYDIPIEVEEIVADFMSLYGRDIIYLLDEIMEILKKAHIA